jgi:hypothetical protein
MDWFGENDEDLFNDQQNNSFQNMENNIEGIYENIFLQKQNSMQNDYEVKMDEFVVKNDGLHELSNIRENLSDKIMSDCSMSKTSHGSRKRGKIFNICKEEKGIHCENNKINKISKEELNNPLFHAAKNSIERSPTKNTASGTKTIKAHSDIYHSTRSIEDYGESESLGGDSNDRSGDLVDSESLINNNSSPSRTQRNFLALNSNLQVNEQQSMMNKNIHCKNNNCPHFYIPLQNLSVSERMKFKKEKAKLLLEKKTKREPISSNFFINSSNLTSLITNTTINNSSIMSQTREQPLDLDEYYQNTFTPQPKTKKEAKMLRNRISAQRSRDRKKKELDELRIISQNLLNENCNLRKQVEIKDREIIRINSKYEKFCQGCKEIYNSPEPTTQQNQTLRYLATDSRRNFPASLRYSLMAGLLALVCFFGTITLNNFNNNDNTSEKSSFVGRILNSEVTTVGSTTPKNTNIDVSPSKSLMLYQNYDHFNNISTPLIKTNPEKKYPFNIIKDFEKKYKYDKEAQQFLGKKRLDFYKHLTSKVGKFKTEESVGFLQSEKTGTKEKPICFNTDYLNLSVQEEVRSEETSNSIILASNYESNQKNHVVPIGTHYTYEENDKLRQNIKSMYCQDFITSAGENSEMFKKLFEKINHKMGEGGTEDLIK